MTTFHARLGLALALGLAGCSKHVVSPSTGTAGLTLLVSRELEPPGARCPSGGTLVHAGLDADHDGVLDPSEVAKTEVVCGPAPGEPPAVLTRTSAAPAGERCAEGGTRVDAGRDLDGDGLLADAEVEQTSWACFPPAPGAPPVLTRVDPVSRGAECPGGGSAVRYGPDLDRDGTLGDAEVAGTRLVCETLALGSVTVATLADAELVSAAEVVSGWLDVRIPDAVELDLHPTTVTGGVTVRGTGLTGLGLYIWSIAGGVTVEGNPNLTRFWMGSTYALGGNVVIQDNPKLDSLLLPDSTLYSFLGPYRYPGHVVVRRNQVLPWFSFHDRVEVGGSLILESNPALRYLFLDGLERVGGDLVLADNDAMEEFPSISLPPLREVGGQLVFRDNASLVNVRLQEAVALGGLVLQRNAALGAIRLSACKAVLGDVVIEDNPVFQLMDYPSDPLRLITGSVRVLRNAGLAGFGQLDGVVEIGGWLQVEQNPLLQRLRFENLVSVDALTVADNPALQRMGPPGAIPFLEPPAFTRLMRARLVSVLRNAALQDLALPALDGQGVVTIQDNPHLPTCQAAAVPASYRSVTGNDDATTCP